jgi:hypothetical protein
MGYRTVNETVAFALGGAWGGGAPALPATLGVWRSHFRGANADTDPGGYANASAGTSFLVREANITGGADGFKIAVGVNDIVTITTKVAGVPDVAPVLPPSPPLCTFPTQLEDDFDSVPLGSAAKYFQDMHGAFEAVHSSSSGRPGTVLRQMAVGQPIGFHGTDNPPLSVVGAKYAGTAACSAGVDFLIEAGPGEVAAGNSAVLGTRITDAQCGHCGVYLELFGNGSYAIAPSVGGAGAWRTGSCEVTVGVWHAVELNITATGHASARLDGVELFAGVDVHALTPGWVGIGTGEYGPVQFDRFAMSGH